MAGEYSDKELNRILKDTDKKIVKFSKSKYFDELTEEQKKEAAFIIGTFTEYMYSYHGLTPMEWNESDLEECCLDTLPRKVAAEEIYYRSIPPVLSAFFDFLGEQGQLGNASKLSTRVQQIEGKVAKRGSDPKSWGTAKSFVMAAKEAGFDPTNEEEMNKFIILYNLKALGNLKKGDTTDNPEIGQKPKIGRNEPCPCGSGKKYKKCCGF